MQTTTDELADESRPVRTDTTTANAERAEQPRLPTNTRNCDERNCKLPHGCCGGSIITVHDCCSVVPVHSLTPRKAAPPERVQQSCLPYNCSNLFQSSCPV